MKGFKILILTIFTVFLLTGSIMAYPFLEVEGFVDPGDSSLWIDNPDGTTTINDVQYTFYVTVADFGAEMDLLSLEFEGDVFLSVGDFTFLNPTDWMVAPMVSSANNLYQIASAGTTLAKGESLVFSADVVLYTAALTSSIGDFNGDGIIDDWTEGQIWGQSWFASDTHGGGDGGSTAPVPEPATMILLGTGLIGLAGFSRKRFFKKG